MVNFTRHDFVIRDLVVSVAGGSYAGTWLPPEGGGTPPSPISPVASVLAQVGLIEAARSAFLQAVEAGELEGIAQAFDADAVGGNAVLRTAIHEIGAAVVAGAAYAELGRQGSPALPNPDCGGTSLETIPSTLTPVVDKGLEIHRVTELPRLRKQLAETMAYVDRAAKARMPHGAEVSEVREQLEAALQSLGR